MSRKRLTLVALSLAGFSVTAVAQRGGGGHGIAAGHSGPAISSGIGGSAARSSLSAPRFAGSRPLIATNRSVGSASPYRPTYPRAPARSGTNLYRRPYNGYKVRTPYINGPWAGWSGATFIGYPGGLGFDDGMASSEDGSAAYGDVSQGSYAAGPDSGQPVAYPQYPVYPPDSPAPPRPEYESAAPAHELPPEEAITLVFKDGRTSQQIHNYMLTSTTLYVRDQHHSEIPLTDLDLAATRKANKDAGVDFQLLPDSSR
jgi:hypothetical protein